QPVESGVVAKPPAQPNAPVPCTRTSWQERDLLGCSRRLAARGGAGSRDGIGCCATNSVTGSTGASSQPPVGTLLAADRAGPVASADRMGSLIKKRRKRMRKKKHKKMLKRTRFQRRNK